jgi:glycosyltransferase involved in cell wall biosynthesis
MPASPVDAHPLVSVVIPTRDRPRLLARALDAVLRQDYAGPIEGIVVFDQCEPDLPELDVPANRTVVALTNTRTPGLAGNRNTGILASKGELVAFCDDDDEWLPAKLTEQVADLLASPAHKMATTGIITVTAGQPDRVRVLPHREITHRMFLRSRLMEVHSSTLLMRRDALLDEIGLVDEEIPGSYAEDYEFLLRASALAPLLVRQAPLVRVDLHPKSFFAEQWQTIAAASRYLLDRHPDLLTEPKGVARIYGRLAIAEAALGNRRAAWRYAFGSAQRQLVQHRAYVALAISLHLLTADRAVRLANRVGKGI